MSKNFWNDSDGFSIVDFLTIIYTIAYLSMMILYVKYPLDSIKNILDYLSPLIYIILGGYFTGQSIQQFKSNTQEKHYQEQTNDSGYSSDQNIKV